MKPITQTQIDALTILKNGDTLKTLLNGKCTYAKASHIPVKRNTLDCLVKAQLIKKTGSLGAGQNFYNITPKGNQAVHEYEQNLNQKTA